MLKTKQIRSGKLKDFISFMDKDGLTRVGGRLIHVNISYDWKQEIILPKDHHNSELSSRKYRSQSFMDQILASQPKEEILDYARKSFSEANN